MIDNDKLTEAFNEYEKLRKLAEDKDYKPGWVFYKLKEKYGQEIASKVYPRSYHNTMDAAYDYGYFDECNFGG